MRHAAEFDKYLEFFGNKLGAIVGNDPGMDTGKQLPGSLNDDFDIGFGHLFSDLKVNDVSAKPIQQST